MDTIQLLKRLKDAVEKLSTELDQSIAREKNLRKRTKPIFSLQLIQTTTSRCC